MVSPQDIQGVVDGITNRFVVDRVILFGSYAYGAPDEDSDVDLLVVMPYEGSTLEQSMRLWSAIRPAFSVDLIVRTPADVARRWGGNDPLIRDALGKGVVLYERRVARVG